MMVMYFICIATVLVGQLIQLPLLGGVITDIVVPIYLGVWAFESILKRRPVYLTAAIVLSAVFLLYAVFSLFVNVHELPLTNGIFGSFAYWVRLAFYLGLLLPFTQMMYENRERTMQLFLNTLIYTGLFLAVMGFLQLIIVPDFSFMAKYGWDPHQGRLLSTWFDPNFLGGFLGMALLAVLTRLLFYWDSRVRPFLSWYSARYVMFTVILTLALVLTFSRSALLGFLVGMTFLFVIKSWRAFILAVAIGAILLVSIPRLQKRVEGALDVDKTAALRIQSWKRTLTDIEQAPLIGQGYNTLRYRVVNPASINTASGRDNSLLTLWLTSGLIGMSLFVALFAHKWIQFMLVTMKPSRYTRNEQMFALTGLCVIALIFTHSMFVHSLVYPHILVFLLMFLAF